MNNQNYLLVTTIKDEAQNLDDLFTSVFSQSLLPNLWYVIDDGSKDDSLEIITKYKNRYSDVIIIDVMEESPRDINWRYHYLIKHGIEGVIDFANKKKIEWEFIGVLDGDIKIESTNYFKKLIDYCSSSNHKIGVVSGKLLSIGFKGEIIREKRYSNRPTGAARLITKELLQSIKEYPLCPTADSIVLQKSRMNNFNNRIIPDVVAIQSRPTSSAEGIKKGLEKIAFARYYIGHTNLFAFFYSIKLLFKYRSFVIFSFFFTFLNFSLKSEGRISDRSVINYRKHYFYNRTKEFFRNLFNL